MSKKKIIGRGRQMSAYGKTMNLNDWSKSKECHPDVNYRMLVERTRDCGWSLEKALTTKPKKQRVWTQRQIDKLMEYWDEPVSKVARKLRKSESAIRHKKQRIREGK